MSGGSPTTQTVTGTTGDTTGASGSGGGIDGPGTGSGASSGSTGAGSTTGEGVVCMDVPVTPGGPLACGGEELALADDCEQLAGYEVCPDGSIHRHTSVACNVPDVLEPCVQPAMFGCTADSECEDFPGGICAHVDGGGAGCYCRYSCASDDDCGAGNACVCNMRWSAGHPDEGGPLYAWNPCVPAQCRSDADCGGARCGVSVDGCGAAEGLYCRTAEDECASHADCAALGMGQDRCAYSLALARWACDEFYACE